LSYLTGISLSLDVGISEDGEDVNKNLLYRLPGLCPEKSIKVQIGAGGRLWEAM